MCEMALQQGISVGILVGALDLVSCAGVVPNAELIEVTVDGRIHALLIAAGGALGDAYQQVVDATQAVAIAAVPVHATGAVDIELEVAAADDDGDVTVTVCGYGTARGVVAAVEAQFKGLAAIDLEEELAVGGFQTVAASRGNGAGAHPEFNGVGAGGSRGESGNGEDGIRQRQHVIVIGRCFYGNDSGSRQLALGVTPVDIIDRADLERADRIDGCAEGSAIDFL